MQVLTGQYPTLYTRKFRLFYSDFQPNNTRRSLVHLFDLPKANQILSSGFYTETQFLNPAASDITAAIWDENNIAAIGVPTGNFNNYRVSLPSNSTNGGFQAQVIRTKPTAPTTQQLFCGFTTPTPIGITLTMPSGQSINSITQGVLLVWVTYFKMP